jgi:hypothetical protein
MTKQGLLSFLFIGFIYYGFSQNLNEAAVKTYVQTYHSVAETCGKQYHIPPSILLAQALIYTKAGTNHLAKIPNNHMAVTCLKTDVDNRYQQDNNPNNICFKKYTTVEESYRDYLNRIKDNPIYTPLFKLNDTDYKGWALGLQKIGHSSNPNYGTILINLIETYQLTQYDYPPQAPIIEKNEPIEVEIPIRVEIDPALLESKTKKETDINEKQISTPIPNDPILVTLVDSNQANITITVIPSENEPDTVILPLMEEKPISTPIISKVYTIMDTSGLITVYYPYSDRPVYIKDGLKFIIASKNDSFKKISKSVQLPETHLRLYNDLFEYQYEPIEGEVVYLQKKKNKCNIQYHTIEMGESLRYISQIYGIRLEKIIENNEDANIGIGYILCISCKK